MTFWGAFIWFTKIRCINSWPIPATDIHLVLLCNERSGWLGVGQGIPPAALCLAAIELKTALVLPYPSYLPRGGRFLEQYPGRPIPRSSWASEIILVHIGRYAQSVQSIPFFLEGYLEYPWFGNNAKIRNHHAGSHGSEESGSL